MDKQIILVPTDFTDAATTALAHAHKLLFGRLGTIHLLHVVSDQEDVASAREKLRSWTTEHCTSPGECSEEVTVGNVIECISERAKLMEVQLVVMGTHGPHGMQRVFGSRALKSVSKSDIPFLIVQNKLPKSNYNHIVLPIELSKTSLQPLNIASQLARSFRAHVHLFSQEMGDEFLENQINNNLKIAQDYLDKKEVTYTIKVSDEDRPLPDAIIRYASRIEADLMVMVNEHGGPFDLFRNFEEQILANSAQIPTLIINPKRLNVSSGFMGSNIG